LECRRVADEPAVAEPEIDDGGVVVGRRGGVVEREDVLAARDCAVARGVRPPFGEDARSLRPDDAPDSGALRQRRWSRQCVTSSRNGPLRWPDVRQTGAASDGATDGEDGAVQLFHPAQRRGDRLWCRSATVILRSRMMLLLRRRLLRLRRLLLGFVFFIIRGCFAPRWWLLVVMMMVVMLMLVVVMLIRAPRVLPLWCRGAPGCYSVGRSRSGGTGDSSRGVCGVEDLGSAGRA
jgi:hypothetical protein